MSATSANKIPMAFDDIRALSKDDMAAVNELIQTKLRSDVALVNQLSAYLINSGGKRLRPLVVVLAARACGYAGEHHVQAAAIIEFIHTATLLHDDVVDESTLRRGQDTANAIWGNEASVLVGDFLYSRAFQMMVELDNMRIMTILADTTNAIAEGEVLQLLNINDPDTSEERYWEVIKRKTACLFSAAACLGAVLSNSSSDHETALTNYGLHLGLAFQLVDDLLDYSASSEDLGKNIGDDLAEGKPTLPVIHALREGNPEQQALLRQAIKHGNRDYIDGVLKAIESTDAINYTAHLARTEADRAVTALDPLPESPYKQALSQLATTSANRTY